ncbi:protein fantom-like [Penaeus chinensis]|uniref:protein fantom-like n=1 Tax=Penaeus chinensis TaxID=139456 RepID=UPI001FB7C742|nr:protein fantom-like [Penaeus chinensis]XP_047474184.1 protein fantom-like [Penaeus chinensis]XP_047474190.1 protein fantom-like [Penaeus chinensis]
MATSDEDHVPVRDSHAVHPRHTAPEEMYWLSHMNQEELREKYIRVRDDFYTLKKFSCRQEDKITKLQTKLRKLISDRKKGGGAKKMDFNAQELEHQEIIETQRQTLREVQSKNEQLEKKLKLANIQLSAAKKNKPMLFRNVGPRVDSGLKQPRTPASPLRSQRRPLSRPGSASLLTSSESTSRAPSPRSKEKTDEVLPEKVRAILEEAREKILELESERDELQEHLSESQQAAEDTEYELQQKILHLEEELSSLRDELRDRGVREERDSVAVVRAQREARTMAARTTALEEQLSVTEEKVIAGKSRIESLQSELERITSKLLAVENNLREQQQEHQKTNGQLQQTSEKYDILKRENEQLQKENDRLSKLSLSVEQRGYPAEIQTLKSHIEHLEAALQTDLSERGNLLEHMTHDKEDLAKAEVKLKELQTQNLVLKEEMEKASQKLNLYSKAGLLNMTPEELSAASRREKEETANKISAKEFGDLKQAHSELQLLYRDRTLELEKTAEALSLHGDTYKKLQRQMDHMAQEAQDKEKEYSMSVRTLTDTIRRRDERIEKMEQQMLTLTDKNIKEKVEEVGRDLSQSLKLGKHDNLLEFHIECMVFEAPAFSHQKTFVSWTVPFSLEDPLQHTNVGIGTLAKYNHSSLYKIHMNYRNLDSLKNEIVTVSVYILLDSGHPAKVGECQITFCEVLDHPRNTLHGTVPVLLAHDDAEEAQHLPPGLDIQAGQVIGTLKYWFRLQRPSEETIAQYLRSVGACVGAPQREDQVPKLDSKIIQSKNPIKREESLQVEEENSGKHQQKPGVHEESDEEEKNRAKLPIPAPRAQSRMSNLHKTQDSSSRADISRESQEEIGQSPHHPENHKQESRVSFRTRSESCSSTGTYNIGSPVHEVSQKSNSDDTSVAKNVASEQVAFHADSSSKVKESSGTTHVKRQIVRPKTAIRRGQAPSQIDKGAIRKGPVQVREKTPQQGPAQKSESLSQEDDSDTMFEESEESSDSEYPESHLWNGKQRGPPDEDEDDDEQSSSEIYGATSSKRLSNRRVKELQSRSKSSSSSQGTEEHSSPTHSNITSDSEGVVAVLPKTKKTKQSKVYVEVCSLTLHSDSSISQDPTVELLFVDYHGFLGLPPDQLETPHSLPKPPPGCVINFNFGQEFSLDEKRYPSRLKSLIDLMKNRGIIKFTVTSEPPEHLQDTHDCQDLGYAYVNLHDLLKRGQDLCETPLTVKSVEDGSQLGTLCITLVVVDVLRHLRKNSLI